MGPNACEGAIRQGGLKTLWVAPKAWGRLGALREEARAVGAAVKEESIEALDRMAGGRRHQGAVGEGEAAKYIGMPELLKIMELRGKEALVLILDGVTDPNNFGALLRTAAAANVDAAVFPERRSAQLNDAAMRASAGTAWMVPLARVTNLGRAIDELKSAGAWVYGMASGDGCRDYLGEKFDTATAIVIGSEGDGLRQKIRERCDALLKIEMPGRINSLNAAAAAAVALFRVLAVRGAPGSGEISSCSDFEGR